MLTIAEIETGIHKAALLVAKLLSGAETSAHALEASDPIIVAGVQLAEKEVPGLTQAEGVFDATLALAQAVATETQAAAAALPAKAA